jgi:hypothetical protein
MKRYKEAMGVVKKALAIKPTKGLLSLLSKIEVRGD